MSDARVFGFFEINDGYVKYTITQSVAPCSTVLAQGSTPSLGHPEEKVLSTLIAAQKLYGYEVRDNRTQPGPKSKTGPYGNCIICDADLPSGKPSSSSDIRCSECQSAYGYANGYRTFMLTREQRIFLREAWRWEARGKCLINFILAGVALWDDKKDKPKEA